MPSLGACTNIINSRSKKDSYGTVANPEDAFNQNPDQLKHHLLSHNERFIDGMFPPERRSIGQVPEPFRNKMIQIVWLRPSKIVSNPCFVNEGVSRLDFKQSNYVGDCWFLAAIATLTLQPAIFKQVVPLDQGFGDGYCGLFHFRFWRFGRWVDVVIDDKLPTINGKLIFAQSKNPNEFWAALFEKAYAKLCGSYFDMQGGSPTEALMDFTGGIFMSARLSPKPPPDLWELMFKAAKSNSMMCCSSKPGKTAGNAELPCGVVTGHAYGITSVDQLISQVGTVRLVRMLNPWGEGEWKGDWSDKSPCWQTVSPQDREKCLCVAENGEFWMALEDLCRLYSRVDICCQCPSFLDGSSECHWKTSIHEGRWVTGSTAGGAQNSATFWTNPQYRVKVEKLSDDCSATQGEYNMLVCLMQKPDKRNRRMVKNLFLGFIIYEVPKEYQGKKLPASFFKRRYIAAVDKYRNKREVMARVALKPGEYVIVPCTSEPDETASFILIIVSKVETHVDEDSCDDNYERIEGEEPTPDKEEEDQENKKTLVHQLSGQYEATDADLLQGILNGKLLKGNLKTGGFSIEACRSMVALLDTKQTGKLTNEEFACLWNKVSMFQDVFSQADVSQKGTLSLKELQSALQASGKKISDDIFNILALRYVSSSGQMTLETFICMALRLDYMIQVFRQLRKGMTLTLRKRDWLYLSMYS